MAHALRITSLYRSVAPWRPAVAWIWLASAIVLVSAGISHGQAAGTRGALAVFLAWAIVREIAPRRLAPALLVPFLAVAFAIPADTDVLACFGVLVAARIAARSVGDPPTVLDIVLLVPFAGWLATRPAGLTVAIVLAAVVFVQQPHRARERIGGLLMLATALVVGSTEGTLTVRPGWDDHAVGAHVLLGLAALSAIVLLVWPLPAQLRARDDRGRGPLRGGRIRVARIAVVAAVAAATCWIGSSAVFALSSASAAVVATAVAGAGARRASDTLADKEDARP